MKDQSPDRMIRNTLSKQEYAISFFKETLSIPVLNRINLNSISTENATFIESDMTELRSDLLFSVKTISGRPANIYLLFEHKSYRDPKIYTQLLSYITAIHKSQTELAPVIPFVFYHDKKKWNLGVNFIEQFKLTQEDLDGFRPYLLDYSFRLFELSEYDIKSLNFSLFLKMQLQLFDAVDNRQLFEKMVEIFGAWRTLLQENQGLENLRQLIRYAYSKSDASFEEVRSQFKKISTQLKEEAMTAEQQLIELGIKQGKQEGKQEGIEQGIEQGLLIGVQELLIKQLKRRFGSLAENERETVFNCKNRERLESASIAFAENKTKEEVLSELK